MPIETSQLLKNLRSTEFYTPLSSGNNTPRENDENKLEKFNESDGNKFDAKNEAESLETSLQNSFQQKLSSSRYYINQTALIYNLAKSRLGSNKKFTTPIISSNKGLFNKKTLNRYDSFSNTRSIAKVTVHILRRQ